MAQTMKNYYTEFPITSAFFIAMIVKGGAERDFVKNKRFCSAEWTTQWMSIVATV
jgi:hypothetical protein